MANRSKYIHISIIKNLYLIIICLQSRHMIVKFYQVFSWWVFIASALYGLGISPINTFPLTLLVLGPGLYQLVKRFRIDPLWKLLYIVLLHFSAFLWVPFDLSIKTLINNCLVPVAYVIFMELNEYSISEVYHAMLTEKPTTFTQFFKNRFL